jgi:GT2 family glycosyltransferase
MSSSRLSPILITVYDRLSHLKQCVDSLKKCPEADRSRLYIASDHAASYKDTRRVAEVRCYVKKIKGFKEVVLIERDENIGAEKNFSNAKLEIFEKYDELIFLEDDVIVGS